MINLESFSTKNKLQEKIFYYFVNNLVTKKEHLKMAESFKLLDINGDGELTKDELIEGFKKQDKIYSPEEIDEIFDTIDADGSGSISYTEYVAAAIEKENLLSDERLETVFKIFDEDKSGKISVEEFTQAFGGASYISEDELVELIREVDLNDDGEVDWLEFRDLMRKMIIKVSPNFHKNVNKKKRNSSKRGSVNARVSIKGF